MRKLRTIGVQSHDRVVLVLPNGLELAVATLAVASSATCVPLNPTYSAAEFDFFFETLNPTVILIQPSMDSPARDIARSRGVHILEWPNRLFLWIGHRDKSVERIRRNALVES